MEIFHMSDVVSLLGIPMPPSGRSSYYVPVSYTHLDVYKRQGYGRTQFNRVYQSVICNYADGTFFVFRPIYLGHKPAVFRDCWLLLYIKAAIPSEKKGA